jgi:hypothetical protein
MRNRRIHKNNSSGFKGIYYYRNRWMVGLLMLAGVTLFGWAFYPRKRS